MNLENLEILETKDHQHAFCVCVTTIVVPTIRAKNRCLRIT